MRLARTRKGRIIGVLAFAGLLTAGTYAFTAANAFPQGGGRAGDGNAAISGYSVTNVKYTLDALDPSKIASYQFDLVDQPATTVKAKILAAQTTWDACTKATTGNTWTCTPPLGTTVVSADNLRVIAVQ